MDYNQDPQPSRWQARQLLAGITCLLILAFQVLVPLVQMGKPGTAYFGWQMYSGAGYPETFALHFRDGTVEPVEPADYMIVMRREIRQLDYLPPHLCRLHDEAIGVIVHNPREGTEWEIPCP